MTPEGENAFGRGRLPKLGGTVQWRGDHKGIVTREFRTADLAAMSKKTQFMPAAIVPYLCNRAPANTNFV